MGKNSKRKNNTICPCGTNTPYEQCCGLWHHGENYLQAPDAQVLMRSRYSAFFLDLQQYLLQTWHPKTRPAQIEPPEPDLKWISLQIHQFEQQDAEHATVQFTAKYRLQGRAHDMHETSRFEKIGSQWYYIDGDVTS